MLLQVLPINDEPPQLGRGLNRDLTCREGGRIQLTVDYLSATDLDSEDSRLTYMLARTPNIGELQRDGIAVFKFSQQDLLQGHIYYLHSGEFWSTSQNLGNGRSFFNFLTVESSF